VVDERLLDAYGARVLATGMAPAVAVALTDPDRTVVARTYGAAPAGSLWAIGSIGKSVTAVLALQLADEGVLDLHAPVTEYAGWLDYLSPITLHHLLTHTAGLIASSDRAPASTYDVIALADTERIAPGEHFHYSDVGYRAVGVVLESVTGRSYGELVQRRVLDRLGMRDSLPVMRHESPAPAGRPCAALRRQALGARARPRPGAVGRVGGGRRLPLLQRR
jgi:D-alanyl-D-alanine carboxypeptidase